MCSQLAPEVNNKLAALAVTHVCSGQGSEELNECIHSMSCE